MTEAQKKALVAKLGAMSNTAFDSRYSAPNRKWFVGKVIDSLLSQSVPDSAVEAQTNAIITKSTKAMNDRISKGFSTSGLKSTWALFDKRKSRTQIIYGMIALNLEFLDAANVAYFDFILERRFRSILRMVFWVNSSPREFFDYPDTSASPPQTMQVNKQADPYWDSAGVAGGMLPFILNATGKADPVTADDKLFIANKGADRNLFACDPVATILHMDALRQAKTPDTLLKTLAGVGDQYLKIDNPLGHFANYTDGHGQRLVGVTTAPVAKGQNVDIPMGRVGLVLQIIEGQLTPAKLRTNSDIPFKGSYFMVVQAGVTDTFTIASVNPVAKTIKASSLNNSYSAGAKIFSVPILQPFYSTLPYHFVTDSRPDHALFEQLTLKATELQVGDHAYVINHPLYKLYYPTGAWGGEHSFITEIDVRDSASAAFRSTLKLAGHGLENTLVGMGDDMLTWINTVLSILQALTRIHLDYLKANGRKSTAGTVTFTNRPEPADSSVQVSVNVFEYTAPYSYTNFRARKKSMQTVSMKKGFVIKEIAATADQEFVIFNVDGTASIVDKAHPAPDEFLRVSFVGAGAADRFTISKWVASFFNPQIGVFDSQPLFESDNKTPKQLTFDDLAKTKPFFAADDIGDFYVTRPRVDFSATYQSFLKSSGAI